MTPEEMEAELLRLREEVAHLTAITRTTVYRLGEVVHFTAQTFLPRVAPSTANPELDEIIRKLNEVLAYIAEHLATSFRLPSDPKPPKADEP